MSTTIISGGNGGGSGSLTEPVSVEGDVGVIDQIDLTNSNPLAVAIVDTNGDQISSFGGGTQYTEGDTDASITGTAILWEDVGDTLSTVSAVAPLPVNIVAGSSSGAQYDDGDARGSATGTLAMGDDGTNIQSVHVDSSGDLQVDVLTMPTVTVQDGGGSITVDGTVAVSGTVTTDTELPAAAALADNTANPTAPAVGAFSMVWDPAGANWDRMRATTRGVIVDTDLNISDLIAGGDPVFPIGVWNPSGPRWDTVECKTTEPTSGQTGMVVRQVGIPAAGALVDNTANPTLTAIQTFPMVYDGITWDRTPGTSTDGALVNLGSNNDVTVTGTVTVDTELPDAAALADNAANPTAPAVGAFTMVWDGATWDRLKGDSTDGALVNLGANNDVTGTLTLGQVFVGTEKLLPLAAVNPNAGTWTTPYVLTTAPVSGDVAWATRQVGMPSPAALADNTANPTLTQIQTFPMVWDGSNWDRQSGFDLANSQPAAVAIVDASGNQITSFGGGTEYTEGDTDASITGSAILWEDSGDTLRAVSVAKPFPIQITDGTTAPVKLRAGGSAPSFTSDNALIADLRTTETEGSAAQTTRFVSVGGIDSIGRGARLRNPFGQSTRSGYDYGLVVRDIGSDNLQSKTFSSNDLLQVEARPSGSVCFYVDVIDGGGWNGTITPSGYITSGPENNIRAYDIAAQSFVSTLSVGKAYYLMLFGATYLNIRTTNFVGGTCTVRVGGSPAGAQFFLNEFMAGGAYVTTAEADSALTSSISGILSQTSEGFLRTMAGALVNDSPVSYLTGDVKPLSMNEEGRLRVVSSTPNNDQIWNNTFNNPWNDMPSFSTFSAWN